MHIFYAPGISGSLFFLDEKESHHCIRVLRMAKGTLVKLIDGRGNLYEGRIADPDQHKCMIEIDNIITGFEKRPYKIHIAISLLKNMDRFEWFVEKSVEIGIDEITPLICRNTEKKSVKTERLKNLIVSAMKQSVKAYETKLNDPVPFAGIINEPSNWRRMIAHCSNSFPRASMADTYSPGKDAVILIGPEGDFTDEEIKLATNEGFSSIQLGNSRLRTETAGIAACHSVYFMNI